MKRLVLYSDQEPPLSDAIDKELKKLFATDHPRIGFIPSASDPERKYYNSRKAYYRRLGMDMTIYFDLGEEWNPELLDSLLECDAIHLSGGNTYHFLYMVRKRNMSDILHRYVDQGGVLIGVSAGSILMTPDISTSVLIGDEVMEGMTDFTGLGMVDFSFFPHHGAITVSTDDLKEYSKAVNRCVYAAKADGGIVVRDNEVICIGKVTEADERKSNSN